LLRLKEQQIIYLQNSVKMVLKAVFDMVSRYR
jgi:hypothetical protein